MSVAAKGSRNAGWVRESANDVRRVLPFLLKGVVTGFVSLAMLVCLLVVAALLLIGVGWFVLPTAVRGLRWCAGADRRRVGEFTGTAIPEWYPALEGPLLDQLRSAVLHPSTRRDLGWLVGHGLGGSVLGLLAVTLPLSALNALLVPAYWWTFPADDPVASPYPVTSWPLALSMPLVAVAYTGLALWLVPRLARWQVSFAQAWLAPTEAARLTERVSELAASRAAALEAHGAELRRIERDLHDGTQNRLVGVVMHLGIIERALRRDPDSALPLILRAQDAADDALSELRDVVRSIYPPVLTERGLDGAVAGLVAHCSVPCTLTVEAVPRVPAAVESAAYFVVAEALTNVAKHSGAEQAEVRLSMRRPVVPEEEILVIEVSDDGMGGAAETGGSGLSGIRRRVGAFDGQTELSSPDGGPTVLRVELPCGS